MNTIISATNQTLNNSIGYISNADKFGRPDVWEAADIGGTGDCKAIALGKQAHLKALGIESFLCTVSTDSGEGHCVLVAKDNGKWVVLDNLTNDILPPSSTLYKWYLTQKGDNWYYLYWLTVFGKTFRIAIVKASHPYGWKDYLVKRNLQSNK